MKCPCCKQELPADHKLNNKSDSVLFDRFWAVYPKRKGSNPKAPARTKWDAAVRRGVDGNAIIAGARAFADAESAKVGTEFIPYASTWLNQRRWEDYTIDQAMGEAVLKREAFMEAHGWHWNEELHTWQKQTPPLQEVNGGAALPAK